MKKNKNVNNIFVYIILLIIFIFLSIIIYNIVLESRNKESSTSREKNIENNEDIFIADYNPFFDDRTINIVINDKKYNMKLENNITAFDLLSILPLEVVMNDLNNNEKYSYLSFSLTGINDYTGKVKKGDVMLYQTNCIVIFYEDFDSPYTYTKIGHIDNLDNFNNENVRVLFSE